MLEEIQSATLADLLCTDLAMKIPTQNSVGMGVFAQYAEPFGGVRDGHATSAEFEHTSVVTERRQQTDNVVDTRTVRTV